MILFDMVTTRRHRNKFAVSLLSAGLLVLFLQGCSGDGRPKKPARLQHYENLTSLAFPQFKGTVQIAKLTWANRDRYADAILLRLDDEGRSVIEVWLNKRDPSLHFEKFREWKAKPGEKVTFIAAHDLSRNGTADLLIIGRAEGKSFAKILWNNGKAVFHEKKGASRLMVNDGIDRVNLVDVDHDGDIDLFLTGRKVFPRANVSYKNQAHLFLNNGRGKFTDRSSLLLPPLRAGIRAASFADYDGDGISDIFLVYGNGQNSLLLNNGLGKFTDHTGAGLPVINDESLQADWADFDLDGDNDLLVVNSKMDEKFRNRENEYSYFLENNGQAYFTKRPSILLPTIPSHEVYLLDANGNQIPDIIILSEKEVHFLSGRGDWKFVKDTRRRLPRLVKFDEASFGDVDGDGYLDILGVVTREKQLRLWINRFE